MRSFCLMLLLLLTFAPSAAQATTFDATVRQQTALHQGPGHTYAESTWLRRGTALRVTARNAIGNWLRVEVNDSELAGWARTGDLSLPEDASLSALVVDAMPHAVENPSRDENVRRLYATPLLPEIDAERVREIRGLGAWRGHPANVVSKVGDSNSAQRTYLPVLNPERTMYELGPYEDLLRPAVDHFGASFQVGSVAARGGMNAFSVFDPFWAARDCEPDETPLACEYRLSQPTVALILFGPNDLNVLNSEQYRQQMTQIVTFSLDQGVIPVLSTFAHEPDAENAFQALRFNAILLDIAAEQDVPLINLWAAARGLPNSGVGADGVHLASSGASVNLAQGHEARFGMALQNLLVLHTLEGLREALVSEDG